MFQRHKILIFFLISTFVILFSLQDLSNAFEPDSVRQEIKSLMQKADRYWTKGAANITIAYDIYDSARSIAEQHFGANDTAVASATCWMAKLNQGLGDHNKSEILAFEAKRIWEETLGPTHPEIARVLRVLGDSYAIRGEYAIADDYYNRGIKLLEPYGNEYNDIAGPLYNGMGLIILRFQIDRIAEAESLFVMAQTHLRDFYGIQNSIRFESETTRKRLFSWWVGGLEINRGSCYIQSGDLETAETRLLNAIKILQEGLEQDHSYVAESYDLLGTIYEMQEKYNLAVDYYKKCLEIRERTIPTSFITAHTLFKLSNLQTTIKNYGTAIQYAERALDIDRNYRKSFYPIVERYMPRLVTLYYKVDDPEKCVDLFDYAFKSKHGFLNRAFSFASEQQKLRYLTQNPLVNDLFLSFAISSQAPVAVASASEMVLSGKAFIIDALAWERGIVFCGENKELSALFDHLNAAYKSISAISIDGIKGLYGASLQDSLQRLLDFKDKLETEISQKCSEFKDALATNTVGPKDIAVSLPDSSLLCEFIRYQPYRFDVEDTAIVAGADRYAVFEIDGNGHISLTDLGDAGEIDSLIAATHTHMQSAFADIRKYGESKTEKDLAVITHRLYEKVFAPLELGGYKQIYISPDGQLNLLPFEILVDSEGSYVVENHQISYLSTGRDLVKHKGKRTHESNSAVVMTNPDYESTNQYEPAYLVLSTDLTADLRYRGPGDRTECLTALFNPLPATSAEGQAIADLLRQNTALKIDYFTGADASESRLKNLDGAPSVLHLATHGYYCSGAEFANYEQITENPLLYTGLALSGANRAIAGELDPAVDLEDGILTSLEASGLDLYGTDLVILSACQTGLGEVANGEGVYGLRRAFQLAGANSVIMSMFNIPDQSTVSLMERFYSNWLSGNPKSTALREASLAIMEDRRQALGAAHPLFWGGFILVGDPE